MEERILHLVNNNRDVLLVGPTDAGKSYFIRNTLIPFFEKHGKKVSYFENLDQEISPQNDYVVILDEFEILEDKTFLETLHPEEHPYYSEEYLEKVKGWMKKVKQIENRCIYIVTRNEMPEIENIKNIQDFSFGKDVAVVVYDIANPSKA